MVSDLDDLREWARDHATGSLLSPATQAERLKTLPTPLPTVRYGLGIFDVNGWLGHHGSLPGYQSLTVYLPARQATLVILVNSDLACRDSELTTILTAAAPAETPTAGHAAKRLRGGPGRCPVLRLVRR